MLFWTLQITVISIVLIFLVHNLLGFFQSTLTVPKIKDLVNAPAQKYENIYSVLNSANTSKPNNELNIDELLPLNNGKPSSFDKKTMKNELKNFLKTKLKTDNDNVAIHSTPIEMLDSSMSNGLNYSAY
jgi:hypothetical protein